ncbi:hypothetical protein LCGC14_0999670 [marine sediment metagenome]|uniref:Uncharacterized protein n=1 Tax=marine sediment metagenome TaxID=412755 RepID=A0A0F9R9K4_9ZZZZ
MWLSANSPLQWDGTNPPDVIQVPPMALAEIYYQGNVPPAIRQGREEFSKGALYNWMNNTVYVLDSTNLTTLSGKSELAHELVHYLQYSHGIDKQVACIKELEPLAYKIQAKYFFTYGGKQLQMDALALLFASTCSTLYL